MSNLAILSYGEIRATDDGRYSVFDTIEVVGGKKNPRDAWKAICEQFPEVVGKTDKFKFPGAGQRLTPVASKVDILYIIGLLPGAVGHSYREDAAQTMLAKLENNQEERKYTAPQRLLLPVEESIAKAEVFAAYLTRFGCDPARCALMGLEVVAKRHPEDADFVELSKSLIGYNNLQENIDYNASELGNRLSEQLGKVYKAQQTNALLEEHGYQKRLPSVRKSSSGENKQEWRWELTEAGKQHAIVKPASSGRWNGPQIRWLESIVNELVARING